MRRQNRHVCDVCRYETDPRMTYVVALSRIKPDGAWEVENEYHLCPKCLRLVRARIEQSLDVV